MKSRLATDSEMVEFANKRNYSLSYRHAALEFMRGNRVIQRIMSSAKPYVENGGVYVTRHGRPERLNADHITLDSGLTFLTNWRAEYLT